MNNRINILNAGLFSKLIGSGLLAGAVGTAIITLSRTIQNKIEKNEQPETFPADVVEKVFGIKSVSTEKKIILAALAHWMYGISLGLIRSFALIIVRKGLIASTVHAIVIQLIAMFLIPFTIGATIKKINMRGSFLQMMHHFLYALTVGLIVDKIVKGTKA